MRVCVYVTVCARACARPCMCLCLCVGVLCLCVCVFVRDCVCDARQCRQHLDKNQCDSQLAESLHSFWDVHPFFGTCRHHIWLINEKLNTFWDFIEPKKPGAPTAEEVDAYVEVLKEAEANVPKESLSPKAKKVFI